MRARIGRATLALAMNVAVTGYAAAPTETLTAPTFNRIEDEVRAPIALLSQPGLSHAFAATDETAFYGLVYATADYGRIFAGPAGRSPFFFASASSSSVSSTVRQENFLPTPRT